MWLAGVILLTGLLTAQTTRPGQTAGEAAGPITFHPGPPGKRPKLVVWITIDAMRGDLPLRYRNPATRKGWRFLLDNGLYYSNAHYGYSTTFTAVGHATLFTGAYTAQHGIAGNEWYDLPKHKMIGAVDDERYPVLGPDGGSKEGFSPANLTASTVGDELVLASGRRSRVFSVSFKDRSAIFPGGHLGKAFWYNKKDGTFITTKYYYKDYPAWVAAWNKSAPADRFRSQVWTLKDDPATYVHRDQDDCPYERGYKYLGRTFPHSMATDKAADFYAALQDTPFGDALTLQFARELLLREKLGLGGQTDMLAISLSSTDGIHHSWGPSSLEAEDNVRQLDDTLGRFFAFLNDYIGLGSVLMIVSADHGIDDIPEYKQSLGYDAGRHDPDKFMRAINDALKERFKIGQDLLLAFWNPSLYLDVEVIKQLNLDQEKVERAVADEVLRTPGFAMAVTRTDLLAGRLTDTPINRRLQQSFHPTRSGQVLVVPAQFWYLYPEPQAAAAMHGTPYAYDTFVPIFVAGAAVRPGIIRRPVQPEDLASTVAAILGLEPPSGNVGTLLAEVVEAMQSPCLAH